jgi:hypothetical protein
MRAIRAVPLQRARRGCRAHVAGRGCASWSPSPRWPKSVSQAESFGDPGVVKPRETYRDSLERLPVETMWLAPAPSGARPAPVEALRKVFWRRETLCITG